MTDKSVSAVIEPSTCKLPFMSTFPFKVETPLIERSVSAIIEPSTCKLPFIDTSPFNVDVPSTVRLSFMVTSSIKLAYTSVIIFSLLDSKGLFITQLLQLSSKILATIRPLLSISKPVEL